MRRSELIALLFSLLFSSVFLFSFALLYEPPPVNVIASDPTPTPASNTEVVQAEEPKDPNDRFRLVPENFEHVDFKNRRYGRYRFGGKKLDLVLTSGEQVIPHDGGGQTFSFKDVLYADVTGDGKPEAIVNLSHVQCGVSCDGGSDLFYIYQSSRNRLRKIWEYETGSMAYGCGLKSLVVLEQVIILEMFGHCWDAASSFEGSGKFMVRDLTRSVFVFNGRRFVQHRTEIEPLPTQNLRSYTPTVHIQQ